jgi:hypothetical protein
MRAYVEIIDKAIATKELEQSLRTTVSLPHGVAISASLTTNETLSPCPFT